jgi:D-amino peptidase
MKIYISADIEGVTGVVHDDQTGGTSSDYMQARKWMTGEVNAAVEGTMRGAGAAEIFVKDAHGNGRNILLEDLREEARLIAGWDVTMSMVQGIDETFDALILIGYHSMAGTKNGILAHTYSGCVKQLSINDCPVGEPEIAALIAGHYGVPVVFVSGDQTVVEELTGFVGEIPHVITKHGMGRESGQLLKPDITHRAIVDSVSHALTHVGQFKPFTMELPLRLSLRLSSPKMADLIGLLPDVEKTSIDEVTCQAEDAIGMFRMFRVMLGLAWSQRSGG